MSDPNSSGGPGPAGAAPPEPAADPEGRGPRPAPPRPARAPLALIVVHGMGQQIPFGTLDQVHRLLRAAANARRGDVFLIEARHHTHDGEMVPCAELRVRIPGVEREVHVYESYWAPLAEGRISTWQTFKFLAGSAWGSVAEAVRQRLAGRRGFRRFLFDRPVDFPVRLTTIIGLSLAALTLAALWIFDTTLLVTLVTAVLGGSRPRWLTDDLLAGFVRDYSLLLWVLLVAAVVSVAVPLALGRARGNRSARPWLRRYSMFGDAVAKAAALAVVALGAGLLHRSLVAAAPGLAGATGWVARLPGAGWIEALLAQVPVADPGSRVQMLALGALVVAASLRIRGFVRTYVGDVAVYVSAHSVNRFHETRKQIRAAALRVGDFVYRRGGDRTPMYEEVAVLGHSLGSVIAYDLVNRMIARDAETGAGLHVAARTRALVTYGSPLDKTAFVFRTQQQKDPLVRESMAASLQPLITDPTARDLLWINVFSRFDWIGGSLDYYDLLDRETRDRPGRSRAWVRPVLNLEDTRALTPIQAHSEHEGGALLPSVVLDAVLSRLPENEDVRAALDANPKYAVEAAPSGP